ncbi:zinc finger CCHC domain-containing protein 7-like isoform X2 [Adelges cooleyi]|nr:zinc finger CCHC domain-containing protein 7-like isoform X2 [Adelges cooleyi]
MESTQDILIAENEFIETSLKKKKKKKKNKVKRESIDKYIELVKNSDVLKEYRVKSGLDEMNTKKSNKDDLAMNVGFQNERAIPMTRSEVLKQYRIGKPTEDTTWYRCPKTWTSDMVKFYTKIQKSKRNFDCAEELKKIRETQGSNPIDWTLDSSDLYKSYSNTPRIKCNYCRQYGHKAFNCKEQYKPQVCIMCGLEGHNLNSCDKQLCFTCGKRQNQFTNNCSSCISKSRIKCNRCNYYGHESKFCTESWRQYHNIISTETGPNNYQSEQSTSTCQPVTIDLSKTKNTKSTCQPVTIDLSTTMNTKSTCQPVMTDLSKTKNTKSFTKVGNDNVTSTLSTPNESKKKKKQRFRTKKNKKKTKLNNNKTSDKESIDIKINIQDVTFKRTLTKTGFLKNKKMKC